MSSCLFDPPRWPDGPAICVYENLPAWKSEKEMLTVCGSEGIVIKYKWRCPVCSSIHIIATYPPSGASSGSARDFTPKPPRYLTERKQALPI